MKLTKTSKELFNEISKLKVIDAHEHIPPEEIYLKQEYSGLNFFAGYIPNDFRSAGMSEKFINTMREPGYKPVSEWWPVLKPFWDLVKNGTYARAAIITAKELYGIDDINDNTIEKLAACIQADNTPGLYRRILKDHCNIQKVIVCLGNDNIYNEDPECKIIKRLTPPIDLTCTNKNPFHKLEQMVGKKISTLNDLLGASIDRLWILKNSKNYVGFKIIIPQKISGDKKSAKIMFNNIMNHKYFSPVTDPLFGHKSNSSPNPLKDYLLWYLIETLEKLDLPLAVHTGVWYDFRQKDPKFMIELAKQFPNVRFDLFHIGMPMVRDAAMVGKNYPNVVLNLAWSNIVSQRMTARALDEILDMVPVNKVFAFGGDYRCTIQKTLGHLVMARETVSSVLGERIDAGEMSYDRAVEIAKMWFYDNPVSFYRI